MKSLWTIAVVVLAAGVVFSGCSRRHSTKYHGVATEMNFGRQVINPKAPDNPEPTAEVSGPIGESIFKRRADTYKWSIPEWLLKGKDVEKGTKEETETGDTD